ncbi:MAG: AMP-binding protein [Burkholderiales bacterium]|nr:AMP-binding protein [Burkholderiales bacterium]
MTDASAILRGTMPPLEVLRLYPGHDYTIEGAFRSRMNAGPEREFLVCQGRRWNWARFHDAALAAARMLVARGIQRGDRVAILARNSDAHALLLAACARIGAIMVPSNPEFGAREAGYVLRHAGVRGVVCAREMLALVREACAGIEPGPWFLLVDGPAQGVPGFFGALESAPALGLPPPAAADDTCLIIYTSGTTGFPKGAMHSQRNFVTAGEANIARLWLQPQDRLMVVLPMFHMNALFYSLAGTIAAGCTLVLMPRFSAGEFWSAAVEHGATQVNVIEAIGRILARRPRAEFRPEHRITRLYGSRADFVDTFVNEFHVPILLGGFGMTEIPGVFCNPIEGPVKHGAMGPVGRHPDPSRPWAQCRVVNDAGEELGTDEVGELWVKHPIVMQGYFRDPEQTRAAFRDGWFMTGDLVRRDADGYYHFVTRKKDIIRRRGENIAGAEIDRVLQEHPGVFEVAAVPVPSELGEDEVLVAIVPRPGATLTAQDIAQWCRERLAALKVPRFVLFAGELPHTPTHKVAKHVLKADPTLKSRAVDLMAAR